VIAQDSGEIKKTILEFPPYVSRYFFYARNYSKERGCFMIRKSGENILESWRCFSGAGLVGWVYGEKVW
jgi:hypothetical protein